MPVQPEASLVSSTLKITCPSCGGGLSYRSGTQVMSCEHCSTEVELPSEAVEGDTLEKDIDILLNACEADPLPQEKMLSCQSCGAKSTVQGQRITASCTFCASNLVEEKPSSPNRVRPTALIPFRIEKEEAAKLFRDWTKSLWFRPNALNRMAKVAAIEGVYVPFWTFDTKALTNWTAERGDYYYEDVSYVDNEGQQRTRQDRKLKWAKAEGRRFEGYDDLLVCASKGLSPELLKSIGNFNTQHGLSAYDHKYLAGWQAEEYAVPPKQAWEDAQERVREIERQASLQAIPGDAHRNFEATTDLNHSTWKHVLLPVWIAAYRYKGKSYRFLVNGESGQVVGESPLSWEKIGSLAAVVGFMLLFVLFKIGVEGMMALGLVLAATIAGFGWHKISSKLHKSSNPLAQRAHKLLESTINDQHS